MPNFGLGGVLTFDLMPLGFGEEGFGGTAMDSLVKELLWKIQGHTKLYALLNY